MSRPTRPVFVNVDRNRFSRIERIVRIDDLMIGRQYQLDARILRLLFDLESLRHHFVFDQRFADGKALRLEKRVSHRAADQQFVDLAFDQAIR